MLILLVSVLVLVLLLLMAWSRPLLSRNAKRGEELRSSLTMIDLAAFQNLINSSDDAYLRTHLPSREYHTAKRARTRATQGYLRWIARDCLVLGLMFGPAMQANMQKLGGRTESLSRMCFRIRILSLALWNALWLQWLFPELNLMPASLVDRYAEFIAGMKTYLMSPQPLPGSDTGQA